MSISLSPFVVDINHKNKEFTLQEIQNYINSSNNPSNLMDAEELQEEQKKSLEAIEEITKSNNIDIHISMTNKDEIGKKLAEIALDHSNALCSMMIKSGREKGRLL